MAKFKLTPAANADLKDIARYTERKWGKEKRNQYLIALDSRFLWLGNNPQLGKRRDEILGVLHQSMDFKQHF